MIKPIMKNPIVRNTAIGLMLTGAALGANACGNSSKTTTNPVTCEQTMSSAAASALAATATATTPSFEHNKDMDRRIIALASNPQEVEFNKKTLNDTYSTFGTYAGTWVLQNAVDQSVYEQAIKDFDTAEAQRLMPIALKPGQKATRAELIQPEERFASGMTLDQEFAREELYNLTMFFEVEEPQFRSSDIYVERSNFLHEALQGGIPSYEKCSQAIDKYAKHVLEEGALKDDEYAKYNADVQNYINNMSAAKRNSVQGKSNIISYKVFLLDYMMLKNHFENPITYFDSQRINAPKFLKYIQGYYLNNTKPGVQ